MNLQAISGPYIQAVNQDYIGTLKASAGYGYPGDANFTGSISGTTLTVTAVAAGALAVGSILAGPFVNQGTTVEAFLSGSGGVGTYAVSQSQSSAGEAMTSTGTGKRVPLWTIIDNVPMQVQALTAGELKQIDGLNIQSTLRSVYLNGEIEGLDRPGVKGGDIFLIPTGLTVTPPAMDTWLVIQVLESFDLGNWSHVAVALQQAVQSQ
jgi:hypothetical protein